MVQRTFRAAQGREKFSGHLVGGSGHAPPENFEN